MGERDVQRVLSMEPFASMDPSRFRPPITLEGIVRNDTRLRRLTRGEIVVRAGDYGNSAFLIVQGRVRVILPPGLPEESLGRASPRQKNWLQALAQLWKNPGHPEVRDVSRYVSEPEKTPPSPARLIVRDAQGQMLQEQILTSAGHEGIRIGRGADNDLILDDSAASSSHARLQATELGWEIIDLGSSNGTFVSGERIEHHILGGGDEIRIGRSHLRFVGEGDLDQTSMLSTRILNPSAVDAEWGNTVIEDAAQAGAGHTFVQDIPAVLDHTQSAVLKTGDVFGEIAALGRTQRTATVFAEEDSILLEIRWQGLRDLRKRDAAFRKHVEDLYRANSLITHLRATPLFSHLPDDVIDEIARQTLFESFGEFDWHTSYQRLADQPEAQRLKIEPEIVRAGDYPDGLLLIRSGFARVTRPLHKGQQTINYLGRGAAFGLDELLAGWNGEGQSTYRCSLRAVGYADILRVPTRVIETHVLPNLTEAQLERARQMQAETLKDSLATYRPGGNATPTNALDVRPSGDDDALVETLVDRHLINGRAAMLINLDRCVRCDACTDACAVGHQNNPRFNRHGHRHDSLMIANACMHCADPVCMIGCPTGAIHRSSEQGQVVINDDTCIGCATCANSCPYDNIRMVEIRNNSGEFVQNNATGSPVMKATKCDLCIDQPGGPACQRACPHDALERVDMRDLPNLLDWLHR
ncbi:cyclic nucleotide-binding domain-containing protein [uncultured Abyssibacter sp.]|uniref:cyclic nucleotide-binding domain-containing protein n=1 Tax=uncultured Abyssibacter sp. TaxID=2320202 RepID=UPI0032B1A66C